MKWEYKTIKLATKGFLGGILDETKLNNFLNELGSQAWELVSALILIKRTVKLVM